MEYPQQSQGQQVTDRSFNSVMSGRQDADVMHIRLDTSPYVEEFEMFLKGEVVEKLTDTNTGEWFTRKIVPEGVEPICNEQGVHALTKLLQSVFNSQVVQGNMDIDMYYNYTISARKEIAYVIVLNRERWGIHPKNMKPIAAILKNMITAFGTRLLANKERESYFNTLQFQQSGVSQEQKQSRGVLGLFRR